MLIIVTALPCEAKPLLDHFKLKIQTHSPFPIYRNENKALIISGIGKTHAALAVGYVQAKLAISHATWLNIGIAGHRGMDIGCGILATQVIDHATHRCYYPTFLSLDPLTRHPVCTVDRPEYAFPEEYVYEMEAAGFMQAALKFSSSELVHCYKVISDNQKEKMGMNIKKIQELIRAHTKSIEEVAKQLETWSAEQPDILLIEEFTQQWHFTETEQHQLARLLHRLKALKEPVSAQEFHHLAKAKDVRYALEKKIGALSLDVSSDLH